MLNLGTKIGEIPIEKFYNGEYVKILKSMEEEHGFKWSNKKLIGNNTVEIYGCTLQEVDSTFQLGFLRK